MEALGAHTFRAIVAGRLRGGRPSLTPPALALACPGASPTRCDDQVAAGCFRLALDDLTDRPNRVDDRRARRDRRRLPSWPFRRTSRASLSRGRNGGGRAPGRQGLKGVERARRVDQRGARIHSGGRSEPAISSRMAPARMAAAVCTAMQPSQRTVTATARAMGSFTFAPRTPVLPAAPASI